MAERRHIPRSLRFTLTAVYTVLFTLLLVGVTIIFRQTLASNLETQARDDLDQSWAVVKGNLRIEGDTDPHLNWFFDTSDPDDNNIRARVQSVYLITDASGKPMDWSRTYQALGFDNAAYVKKTLSSTQPLWQDKRDASGVHYRIRSSYILNESRTRKFYVAIGTSLAANDSVVNSFTWLTIGLVPVLILAGIAAGWVIAGRALEPVMQIARAAQRISGSNLSLRIPERSAADELEYLIETFNAMIARLEQNFNQVRQFSTDVSHELRTPITVIRGQLEVALMTAKSAEQYREAIVDAFADVERLSQIVRALLLLSQAETGQVILQRQPMDLVETTRNITEEFEIPAEGSGVRISFHAAVEKCDGDFDRVQIERMLSNLISNAVKFTPSGGEVLVSVDCVDNQAEIVVADTGKGIPPEHLPHIFDRFYRVRGLDEQASPEKGLGLGLSFVDWIVRAHSGTITVESKPGEGTKFRVRLPFHSTPPELIVTDHTHDLPLMKPV